MYIFVLISEKFSVECFRCFSVLYCKYSSCDFNIWSFIFSKVFVLSSHWLQSYTSTLFSTQGRNKTYVVCVAGLLICLAGIPIWRVSRNFQLLRDIGLEFGGIFENQENFHIETILTFNLSRKFAVVMPRRKLEFKSKSIFSWNISQVIKDFR